jgi:hypothetical protein
VITIQLPDGSTQVIEADAFVLVAFKKEDPSSDDLSAKTFSFPGPWVVLEGVDILGETLTQEEGEAFKVIGAAVQGVVVQGRDIIKAAVKEMKSKMGDA